MRALAPLAIGAAMAASPVQAHFAPGMLTDGPVWEYDPWLMGLLYLAGLAFWLGSRNLWRSAGFGRGIRLGQAAAFWTGWTVLAMAFASPLHWLGERLFAAHMVEHQLLILVAAPLLAYARPSSALLWALPLASRKSAGVILSAPPLSISWTALRHPVTATTLHAAALWGWHAPPLYAWALKDVFGHRIEHLIFFSSSVLFWWMLFYGRGGLRAQKTRDAVAIGCLFVTVLHSGLLGALLTLSTQAWYPDQERMALDLGLTPLEDQQLAGLVMWVPMSLVYTGTALFFAHALLVRCSRQPSQNLA